MSNFNPCFQKLMEVEGGFVNNTLDRGGATKFGITIPTLSGYMNKTATVDDIARLTELDASRIYSALYWDAIHLDDITDWRVAYCLFDQVVNRGQIPAVRNMQKALNKNLSNADLKEDGVFGPKTAMIINAQIPEFVGSWYLEMCQLDYVRIVEFNQSQLVFLRGWLDRTHKMQRLFWDKEK